MNDQLLFEQVEKYLLGQMSKQEMLAFEQEMQQNQALKELTAQTKAAMEAIHLASLRQKMSEIEEKLEKRNQANTKSRYLIWTAVAAAVLIGLSIPIVLHYQKSQHPTQLIYAQYFEKDPGMPTLMDQTFEFEFDDAMIDYKLGEYKLAIRKFLVLQRDDPDNDLVKFYLGMSYLNLNKTKQAGDLWKNWAPRDPKIDQKRQWYQALIDLKQQNMKSAKNTLIDISQNPAHSYYQKAQQLIVEIENAD